MEQSRKNYCERGFRWFPCVFIFLVVLWSYYAYVVELCIYTIDSVPQKVLYIIFYQAFFFMFLWSFSKTVFTDPMNPAHEYTFPEGMFEQIIAAKSESERQEVIKSFAGNCNMEVRNHNGGYRYCMVTGRLKPDRCHYCSVVKQCVLKMDHYCPWVNNCVGFSNYKFFCLFLFYGLLYCLYVAGTSLEFFLLFWQDNFPNSSSTVAKLMVLFLFFAAAMFAFSLTTLFFYHLWLVLKNKTTIESWRPAHFRNGPDSKGFHLGARRNFEQVFGENPSLWLIPVFTSLGDGQTFPTRLVQQGDVENGFGTNGRTNDNSIRSSNSNGKSKASTLQFDEKNNFLK